MTTCETDGELALLTCNTIRYLESEMREQEGMMPRLQAGPC